MVRLNLDESVYVKMKGERELVGRLHAFDQHMNLVLGEVEETRRFIDNESETTEDGAHPAKVQWKTEVKKRGMLFIRGDAIILLSPVGKAK